ncbi:unnamed protein product [Vicia faba]|uniref:DJ-1/PfpI domain-containing protein n=1 Tax=Vicia faba TaxID=3906 RepID=A0AAV0ZIX2_VICFA|nr:unnamed protein product [Vicia faba]
MATACALFNAVGGGNITTDETNNNSTSNSSNNSSEDFHNIPQRQHSPSSLRRSKSLKCFFGQILGLLSTVLLVVVAYPYSTVAEPLLWIHLVGHLGEAYEEWVHQLIVAREVAEFLLMRTSDDNVSKKEFNEIEWSVGHHPPSVLIPIAHGSEEIEVVTLMDILRRAKANVIVASVEKTLGVMASQGTKIVADKLLSDVQESSHDLIILPGGTAGTQRLSKSRILKKLLKEQNSAGRIYGAICSSPAILHKHGLLKNKKATAHPSVLDEPKDRKKLQAAIKDSVSENEAFQKVFGKEKHGYVRSMGLGVTPSQINRSTRSTSSFAESEQIKEMQEEINALKEKNSKIDELTQAIIFLTQRDKARTKEIELLMQMQNFSGRQGLESPADGRRSSESSYRIGDNGTSGGTN